MLGLVCLFLVLAVCEVIFRPRDRSAGLSNDGRLLTNFGLSALVLFTGGLLPLARVTSSLAGERFGLGIAHGTGVPWAAMLFATLLLDSFAFYWVHRFMHARPLFWRLHRVHHSDSAVDVSTTLRNHPLELLVTMPASMMVVIVLGSTPSVVLATQAIFTAAKMWEHADIQLPREFDRMLSYVIITPNVHRVHHSVERGAHDSNFGDLVTIWDRLFGSFAPASPIPMVGLEAQRARSDDLLQQICSPLYPV
jgi:sterol desaturase/sphingolipid hydroxylase (fatty acid hydroxylase superfamily)